MIDFGGCIRALYPIAAIIGIAVIEVRAIAAGINGEMLLITTTAIAGLGGYYFAKEKTKE